jgi:NAD(P)-dependent dehydrogenase (short-subunit alcohol dehydrogenase family)
MEARLRGKTVVVTGATSGIGLETAIGLARLGADVALTARDPARGEAALAAVRAAGPGGRHSLHLADLSRQAEVRRLAGSLAALPRLDVLVNNAGAIHARRKLTADGLEMTFAVNHLAPYLLTRLLAPRLSAAGAARVVTVASEAHRVGRLDLEDLQAERGYAGMRVYGTSKLCNILFAAALARRLAGSGVTSTSLHPGVIATGFGRNDSGWLNVLVRLARPLLKGPAEGARTSIHCAAHPSLDGVTGRYFKDCREVTPAPAARDEALGERLWEASARLVGLPA